MHKENKNYNKMSFLKILKIRMITNKNQKLRNSLIYQRENKTEK